jgi:hypothetical protein
LVSVPTGTYTQPIAGQPRPSLRSTRTK